MVWRLQIMTMHVFPRVEIIEEEDGGEEGGALDWKNLPPEYLMTVCSPAAFKHLAKAKTPSWTQKKRMLEALKEMYSKYEAVEAKMVAMESCSADEQKLYESSSLDNLQVSAVVGKLLNRVANGCHGQPVCSRILCGMMQLSAISVGNSLLTVLYGGHARRK